MPITRRALTALLFSIACNFTASPDAAEAGNLQELRIDYATYNPLSLVLKEKGILEKLFANEGIAVRFVQSQGSNKALEFLNAGAIDIGSTAGSAALVACVNGNPIKAVYVYSRPEWTALVTRKDSGITKLTDLKGKRVAATRGTDAHIFLVQALGTAGLTEKDIKLVPLQHGDGRIALDRGDVDAWAGLDPMMAASELENGDVLFYRNAEANSWGVLDVREDFAKQHPDVVAKVLSGYEEARRWALANPRAFKDIIVAFTRLPAPVIDRQIDTRTDLTHNAIGDDQRRSIVAAGRALQSAGILPQGVDVNAAAESLVDAHFFDAAEADAAR